MKSRGISNQPIYNQDRTDLAATVHMIHRVQNNIAEASSFTHTLSSNTVPVDSHGPQKH
jgi:hypothetical protein